MLKTLLTILFSFILCSNLMAEEPKYFKNSIGMVFAYIPAGQFNIGLHEDENVDISYMVKERIRLYFSRIPKHTVNITKPFYFGAFEVTQRDWKKVLGVSPPNQSAQDDNLPVVGVSFAEIQRFLSALNKLENTYQYRLPTETEWEYAARAGVEGSEFPITKEGLELSDYCWYDAPSNGRVQPVGQKLPNPWGLYDMCGNVSELTSDWYSEVMTDVVSVSDPQGDLICTDLVFRGASAIVDPESSLHSYRYVRSLEEAPFIGLRIVASID
jgi:formylglycine-generating enzyme required for sulfatase activity